MKGYFSNLILLSPDYKTIFLEIDVNTKNKILEENINKDAKFLFFKMAIDIKLFDDLFQSKVTDIKIKKISKNIFTLTHVKMKKEWFQCYVNI